MELELALRWGAVVSRAGARRITVGLRLFAACLLMVGAPALRADTLFASSFGAGFGSPSITEFAPGCFQCQFTTGLVNASGMAFDGSGNLYVADGGENLIVKYNPNGAPLGPFASGLNFPFGLAFDGSGNLFVSNTGTNLTNGTIFEITPGGTQSLFAFGLAAPEGLAFDSHGNLFEADHSSGNIYEFSPGGGQTVFASGLTFPSGLAFDRNGNLFVSSFGSSSNNGAIYEFSPTGVLLGTFASGLSGPIGLAFDSSGNLFEADELSSSINEFTPGGVESTFASGVQNVDSLAFAPTPEPGTLLLLGSAFAALGGMRKRIRPN